MSQLILACLISISVGCALSPAIAEITMPPPPTPPTPPSIVNASPTADRQSDPVSPSLTIVRIDSLSNAIGELEDRLHALKEERTELEKKLSPASRNDRVYSQDEVETRAIAVRRQMPVLPESTYLEVQFVVSPSGKTQEIRLLSGPTQNLAEIERTVETWLYSPAIREGRRVPVRITASLRISER